MHFIWIYKNMSILRKWAQQVPHSATNTEVTSVHMSYKQSKTSEKCVRRKQVLWSWAAACVRPSAVCVCRCSWRPTRAANRAAAAGDPQSKQHRCPPGSSSTDRAGSPTPPAHGHSDVKRQWDKQANDRWDTLYTGCVLHCVFASVVFKKCY